MIQMLYVGMGGFVGSIARYLLVGLAQSAGTGVFPYGTLLVNILGCVAIGGMSELLERQPLVSTEARAFLVIGLLGGFTTFSAFGNETINLFRDAGLLMAVTNIIGNVTLAVGGVWFGRTMIQMLSG